MLGFVESLMKFILSMSSSFGVVNERPVDVQSRSVTEPQRDGVVLDGGGDKKVD